MSKVDEIKEKIEQLSYAEFLEICDHCEFLLLWDRLQKIKKAVPRLVTCAKES